jgi:hypothetical protein
VHEKVTNQSNSELPSSSPTRSSGPPCIQIDVQIAYDLHFGCSTYARKAKEITFPMASSYHPLVVVVPLGVVILVGGGVKLLPLVTVGDEVSGVAALKAALRRSPLLLAELIQCTELSHQQAISLSGMLPYCSSEAATKENNVNSKADETVVLVGLASWPPT